MKEFLKVFIVIAGLLVIAPLFGMAFSWLVLGGLFLVIGWSVVQLAVSGMTYLSKNL